MKIIVKKDGELLNYLYENLDMPKKRIKQYLSHGAIYVNNNQTTKYNYPLVAGMNIVIQTENSQKKELPFDILLEDSHLLIINKPSGLPIFSTNKEKENSLFYIVKKYLLEKEKTSRPFLIQSLDKDASGIVIFSKDEKTKKKLQDNWKDYVTKQEFVAVVNGTLRKKEGQIRQYVKESKMNLLYICKENEGEEVIIDYKVLKENEMYSLLEINQQTNKKGQVRIALSSIKHPILGDQKYGDKHSATRLYLHANRIKFYYPEIKKEILIETAIPQELKRIVK